MASLSAILALSDAHHVTWLEILGDVTDVDLQQVELRNINGLEGDHSALNLNDRATHSSALTFIHTDFVAFHIDGLAALHHCLFYHKLNFSV